MKIKRTKEEIFELVKEQSVKFIRLQFTDIFGVLKNVAITVDQLEKACEGYFGIIRSALEANL